VSAAPDGGEKFFSCEDTARVGGELIEEAEFEQAGGDGFVEAGDEIGVEIDAQIVELENLLELGVWFSAPEKKFAAGEEFAWAKGLGDVIVGAGFEGGDEVVSATASGEHDDGQALKQRVLAGFGEFVADEDNNVGVVLDKKNTFHRDPWWGNSGESVQQEGQIGEGWGKKVEEKRTTQSALRAQSSQKRREEKRREEKRREEKRKVRGHDLSCPYTEGIVGTPGEREVGAVKNLTLGDGSCDRRTTNFGLRGLRKRVTGRRVYKTRQNK
jgi:hypothetical protein